MIFSIASFSHGLGELIQFGEEYFIMGEVKTMLTYFPFPIWGQLIIVLLNTITISLLLAGTVSALMITGLLTLEIETQCAVLCAAMVRGTDDGSQSFTGLIADHVQIIKNARWLIDLMESLNSPAFSCFYFHIAIGLVIMKLVETNGYLFYVSMAFGFMSVILQTGAQGWFSSAITHSLESIAFAAYETNWYERDKNYARDVLMVIQMGQLRFVQKIFFRSIEIDRATVLRIVRSSYSFYTILMIIQ
ncbi:hypothetical protein GE061_009584 [Apolygus lucorum]|uniref:Olfactory receptor n=1 Tax=Apolygus lucorum TaxID=248454 RepID=A0A6A4JV43_APOLU|nr:hypothetical protein GE061_009584 [Apolygus lucorum]